MQGQIIKIDILEKYTNDRIYAKQYDYGRKITFFITENGQPLNLTGYTVQFQMKKPDGTMVVNDCYISDPINGKVVYTLSKQATTMEGFGLPYQLQLFNSTLVSVATLTGYIRIDASVIQNGDLESSDDFSALENILNTKMNKVNPTGTGSFSLNRKTETTIGSYSSATGYNTAAIGNYSHAEGTYTVASGYSQHVQGQYNVEDSTKAHIVGGGTSDSNRKNIHTIDWNGNAVFAGSGKFAGNVTAPNIPTFSLSGTTLTITLPSS